MPGGPFDPKVLLDESGPVAVHTLDQLNRLGRTLFLPLQPAHLFFKWRIDEHMDSVLAIAQIVRRTASNDHGMAFGGGRSDEFFGQVANAFSIRDSQILLTYAARMATQVLREGSTSRLTDGLVAHLIEGERDDWRENVIVLTLLFDAARKLGVDPLPIFDHVASLAAGDAAAETLGGFRKRKPEMLTIESMGYRTAMSAQGVRYEPDPAVWRQ